MRALMKLRRIQRGLHGRTDRRVAPRESAAFATARSALLRRTSGNYGRFRKSPSQEMDVTPMIIMTADEFDPSVLLSDHSPQLRASLESPCLTDRTG